MLTNVARRCLDCRGKFYPGRDGASQSRCQLHSKDSRPRRQKSYTNKEKERRKAVVMEHIKRYGYVCPGYERSAHSVGEGTLTADHILPQSKFGTATALGVLCRSCNARKGNRV